MEIFLTAGCSVLDACNATMPCCTQTLPTSLTYDVCVHHSYRDYNWFWVPILGPLTGATVSWIVYNLFINVSDHFV